MANKKQQQKLEEEIKKSRKEMERLNPQKKQTFISRDLIKEEHRERLKLLLKQNPALEPIISIFLGNADGNE